MAQDNIEQNKTPAEERAQIGTPAGEDAGEGRKRHGTVPLTSGGDLSLSERKKEELHKDLQADQSANPEEAGQKVRGVFTEQDLEEEGVDLGAEHELTGTEISGGSHGQGHPEGGTPGGNDKTG